MDKDIMQRQLRLAFLLIAWRIPGTVTAFLAASASKSMVVWMEFIENASVLIPGIILLLLSRKLGKNLKYKFNYGTGKLEAITALSCEMFDIAGLACVFFFAIRKLFQPEEGESYLMFAIAVSVIGVLIDLFILYKEKKLTENEHSKMLHTAYVSAQKEFGFDFISILTLIVGVIFRDTVWVRYFSPIVCLVLVVPFSVIVVRHLIGSLSELIDRTLDEDDQFKILRALNEFFDAYEELGEIRSRVNGKYKDIDITLRFHPQMSYQEVSETADKIRHRVAEEIEECNVHIEVL